MRDSDLHLASSRIHPSSMTSAESLAEARGPHTPPCGSGAEWRANMTFSCSCGWCRSTLRSRVS